MAERAKIPRRNIGGIPLGIFFNEENILAVQRLPTRPTDVIIVTYPKSGTNWMSNIVSLILLKGQPPEDFVPQGAFLDLLGLEKVEKLPSPRVLLTHLPPRLVKLSPDVKYIFVARNPRDTAVSFFHHLRKMYSSYGELTFDDFFDSFIDGTCDYGDYFDFYDAWAKHFHDDNLFFITYEDLKADTRSAVLKLAKFLGPQYQAALEEDDSRVQAILDHSTVDSMKVSMRRKVEGIVQHLSEGPKGKKIDINVDTFVRKGVVGDWKNHMSDEQVKRLDEKFKARAKGTALENLWKDYM